MPPGALVTVVGGSGFIGRYVVQQLAAAGHRLRVVTRTPETAMFLKPLGGLGQIQLVAGDIRDAASLASAFAGADAGVNLVGILAEGGGRTFAALQAEGAGKAAQAAAQAGARHFVQISAIGADAASAVPYARTKAQGEVAVLAAMPGAAILRPSIVGGPEDQFFNRFASMATLSPVLPVIAGDSRFQPVHVVDVADAVVAALVGGIGGVFELGGPEVLSFRAILQLINRLTARDRVLLEISPFEARLLARLGDVLPFMPMTSDQLAMLQKDNVVAPGARTLAGLGIAATPLAAYLPRQLERYRPKGRFNQAA
ncbi:hypothetical protein IP88_08215 [alpha proteobacterium AAP81b]|nr:hypothetical protein IP88_08215 [alpha proteobacterium AAP81b]